MFSSVHPRFNQNSTQESTQEEDFKMYMKMNKETLQWSIYKERFLNFIFLTYLTEKLLCLLFFHLAKCVKSQSIFGATWQLGGSNFIFIIIYTSTLIHFKYIFYFPLLYYLKGIL